MIECRDTLEALLFDAHNRLHRGDVDGAHECIHKAMGLDNDAPAEPPQTMARSALAKKFDERFRALSAKLNTRAAYVLLIPDNEKGGARVISGGEQCTTRWLDGVLAKGLR